MRRLHSALIAVLAALAWAAGAPAAAHAVWFPSEAIDGPSADVVRLGGADMGRDGTGGLVYIKREGGVPHVFLSRFSGGAWQAPERVDAGIAAAASDAVIAATDGNRLMVLWAAAGRLYGSTFAGAAAPGALTAPVELFNGGGAELDGLDADMGINGTAYGVWRTPAGAGGGDVNAVRLQGSTFELVPAPLDVDASRAAGDSSGRPRVAVSAEGNAVATWGESGADGLRHVYARRVTGLAPSQAPQEVSMSSISGLTGGNADSPDIAIEYDGSFAWVAFRQDFAGVSRGVARRLVGSQFEAPSFIDVGTGGSSPRIAMTGRGVGLTAASAGGGGVVGALLESDAFAPAALLGSGAGSPDPVVATDERDAMAVAWLRGDGALAGRFKPAQKPFEAEAQISSSALGALGAGDYAATADRLGGFAVGMAQGPAGARAISAAVYDRPPSPPSLSTSSSYQRRSQPLLRWKAGLELWGPTTFKVLVDGVEIGATTSQSQFVAPAPVAEGRHRWSLIAVDRRGQQTASKEKVLRIDSTRPRLRLRLSGTRRRGGALRIVARGSDPKGSGLAYVQVDYGDRSRATRRSRSTHRYRSGRYTLRAKAVDKAGNVTRRTVRLRIGR